MVKKKAKTNKSVTLFGKQFGRSTLLIGAVILAVVSFAVYTAIANELDRRKFAQIEETVNSLVDRIDAEFETNVIADSSRCYKASRKLDDGPLICVFEKQLDLNASNISSASEYISEQSDLVSSVTKPFSSYIVTPSDGDYSCLLEVVDKKITIGCSAYGRTNYYPIRN